MADIVNLNQFRKAKTRADKSKTAQDNRAKFGRTKAEKAEEAADRDKREQDLSGKEIPDNSDD